MAPFYIPITGADAPMLLSATQFYSTSYLCSETKEHWNSAFLSVGCWSSVLAVWAAKHRRGVVEHVYHLQPGGEEDQHGVSLTCWWLYLPNIKRNVLNICSLYKIINKCRDKTGSSWFNCALRGDEAVYWVSKGQQWLVLGGTVSVWGGNLCCWVSGGHWCLYILKK